MENKYKNEFVWNPWHGCRKYSEGCMNCYVYRRDGRVGRDASQITRNSGFSLPAERDRSGNYKIPDGAAVFCCMTSDFFLPEADAWRAEVWDMIRERSGVSFFIITKRITRFYDCIPGDWGDGWENVTFCCTCENRVRAAQRLPLFSVLPIKHKMIVCEPLLERVCIKPYLAGIELVIAGGESGPEARECDFDWFADLSAQCAEEGVAFRFKQTGARFRKDGKLYRIPRALQHSQARLAGIDRSAKSERL